MRDTRQVALLCGFVLLLIFFLFYVPYEIMRNSNYLHLIEWDNPEKELTLSCGAFIIAGCFPEKNEKPFFRILSKLIPLCTVMYAIIIVSFGIDHFMYARGVAEYIPSWIPNKVLWAYVAGLGLFGFGLGILLKIKRGLMAFLLGSMILIWVFILHIPKVIYSTGDAREGEMTSAFLALVYSGISFVIAGVEKNRKAIPKNPIS
jgi:uncharacterized membrane protein